MTLLHEKTSRFRALLYWGMSCGSLLLAWRTPGLDLGTFFLAVLGVAVLAFVVYRYALWLTRLDGRHRHVHPGKFRVTTIAGFYDLTFLAIALAGLTPLFAVRSPKTPLESAVGLFLAPVLLAGAAAVLRGKYEREADRQIVPNNEMKCSLKRP